VPVLNRALLALKRIAIVIGIAIAFSLGLLAAIYWSLRSSETKVPDIVGKDRAAAENTISDAGLNFRVRAMRATSEAKPDTVLIQLPRAGEIVKVGQTVAVDISRPTKEGEPSTTETSSSSSNGASEKKQESSENRNTQTNTNENRPKRKPVNRNSNDNINANANANRLANRNGNANRATTGNENTNRAATPSLNVNRSRENSNRGNVNRRAVVAPTP
jgi:beta-lactam-binding protein with PASTA domain